MDSSASSTSRATAPRPEAGATQLAWRAHDGATAPQAEASASRLAWSAHDGASLAHPDLQRERVITLLIPPNAPDALNINILNTQLANFLITNGFLQTIAKNHSEIMPTVGRLVKLSFAVHNTMQDIQ